MALVFTKVSDGGNVEGKYRTEQFDVTLDSSYPTGGTAISGANVGLKRVVDAVVTSGNANAAQIVAKFDNVNGKLQCFHPTGGAAAPATLTAPVAAAPGNGTLAVTTTPDAGVTNLTGSAAKPALAGVVSGAIAAPALTGGIGIEVGNTTDLSALKVRMKFIGF